MSHRKTVFVKGEYYHVYNRGNSKQVIFRDKDDYDRFLKLLFLSNTEESFRIREIGCKAYDVDPKDKLVGIGAYCLMPNHFHLLLTQVRDEGLSRFMQKLSTGYSMYFNKKHDRSGGLFEGKFKAEHASSDNYLKYLFSYIHLNPIKLINKDWKENGVGDKSRALKYLEQYFYSSFLDYVGQDRVQRKIINPSVFPDYFPDSKSMRRDVIGWLNIKP